MQVAAGLVDQIAGDTRAAPARAPSTATPDAGVREAAELGYERGSIRFEKEYGQWVTYQGNQELAPEQFYTDVGRPDLAETYRHRRRIAFGGLITCGVGYLGGLGVLAVSDSTTGKILGLASIGVGLVGVLVGGWYGLHPHPVSENDAKVLADVYNRHLRSELMLPVARSEPLIRDLELVPVVTAGDYGVALAGRF
jgi:hypothetical protein